ncbi:MAG: hypothetical protein SFX73_02165 [Kofleriaceae bacterium]|nr:hypothetical protein [Kofleriaceae bacterium]
MIRPLLLASLAYAGCGFSVNGAGPPGDATGNTDGRQPAGDAAGDAPSPDAQACFGSGFGALCLLAAPSAPLILPSADIDTGTDARCTVVTIGGVEVCVLAGTTVTHPSGTLRAHGSRPLVVLATQTLQISGTLDVSSTRTGPPGAGATTAICISPDGGDDNGGASGGGGGSFGGRGGDGGVGDTDGSDVPGGAAAATFEPASVRGGCPGGAGGDSDHLGGAGGRGGGAVYLIAGVSITIDGMIWASGAGGSSGDDDAGGGGGGAGGLIGLDAPSVTIMNGTLVANGGGGGEGGGSNAGAHGLDGTHNTTIAFGGEGDEFFGGDGGDGSGGNVHDASDGQDNLGGGGGGGGGIGYVYVAGTFQTTGATVSAITIMP